MGQSGGALLTPCVARTKQVPAKDRDSLLAHLKHAEALIADPEKIQGECDFHFRRAGLDAHGALRRVELRRLLWTFAHSLGSTELTWEAIEAAAVAGTLEPHVPVVTGAEFYRCVLKTVHLVAAELRRKVAEADAWRQARASPQACPSPEGPRGAFPSPEGPRGEPHSGGASSAGSASSRCSSPESSHGETPSGSVADPSKPPAPSAPPRGPAQGGQAARGPAQGGPRAEHQPVPVPLFRPAPGGSAEEAAPVNGMTVMVLSNEGAFDTQRLFVGQGVLALSSPGEADPSAEQGSAFDLSLLEIAASGEDIADTPLAPLISSIAVPAQGLDRMLVLGFSGDEALCLWFATPDDCELCHRAVLTEGAEA